MPHIVGTEGDDVLVGTTGDDLIEGLGGNDLITDTNDYGDDQIFGGDGDDTITISRFGEISITPAPLITVDGGTGDDLFLIGPVYGRQLNLTGGTGRDRFELTNAAIYVINAGADDDMIRITALHGSRTTTAHITMGAGADVLLLSYATFGTSIPVTDITFTDFAVGNGGDRIDFDNFFALQDISSNGANPISSLTQQGSDAVLQFVQGGSITFQNTSAAALTAFNLGGYTTGGLVNYSLVGTASEDVLAGQLGNDDVHGGDGDDVLTGGYGDDTLFGDAGNDLLNGGPGLDTLHGGDDDDTLSDTSGRGDTMFGDAGNDTLIFDRPLQALGSFTTSMDGGDGDDLFEIRGVYAVTATIVGGAGEDVARVGAAGGTVNLGTEDDTIVFDPTSGQTILVTLGAGSDLITFDGGAPTRIFANGIHITDFQTGDGGDRVDLFEMVKLNWDYATNPLSSPDFYEQGGTTILGLIKFDSVSKSSFTAFNFLGFAPDGSPFAGATFTGTPDADAIDGGKGGDLIQGLGGDDTLRGGWGNDQIDGGDDNDEIDGDGGSDTVSGGAGDDFITDFIQGSDTLSGDGGNDVIIVRRDYAVTHTSSTLALDGGTGDDTITIEASLVGLQHIEGTVSGGDGNDMISVDTLWQGSISGGIGNDVIRVFEMANNSGGGGPLSYGIIDAGDGDDLVELLSTTNSIRANVFLGAGGHDLLTLAVGPLGTAGVGDLVLRDFQTGAAGDRIEVLGAGYFDLVQHGADVLLRDGAGGIKLTIRDVNVGDFTPNNLGHRIDGTSGDDLLEGGGPYQDRLIGGEGNDTYYVSAPQTIVVEAPGEGYDIVYASVSYALGAGVEVEFLSTNSHAATVAINLTGNAFNQTIVGNDGANQLHGGGGADVLVGLGGNDIYYTDVAATQVQEAIGGGNDQLYTSVSYVLGAGSEVELLSTSNSAATTAINLTGNALGQTLLGNDGVNVLHGGGGADVLVGLGGNDIYYTDVAATQVVEAIGGGNDQLYTSVSYVLGSGEVELLSTSNAAGTAAINLTGNALGQTLLGNDGANVLHGGGGVDVLMGLGGNDIYYTDVAATQVVEGVGGGNDQLYTSVSYVLGSGSEVELLSTSNAAGTAALNLTGNGSGQALLGNAGANVLDGKGGADTLLGLGGADTFAFSSALGGGNVDVIGDFSAADDVISLDDAIFTALGLGALSANAFVIGSAALDADDRIIYNSSNGALFYDADGNGAGAAVQFATLSGAPAITANDFMVI